MTTEVDIMIRVCPKCKEDYSYASKVTPFCPKCGTKLIGTSCIVHIANGKVEYLVLKGQN